MKIVRQFNLISGRVDGQYISAINSKGQPTGYDRKKVYAVDLTEWQATRCKAYLRSLGVKFRIEE